jgi:ArsR family transcriptional regulator, nickel/cobalt-responsive transcriptional repressor
MALDIPDQECAQVLRILGDPTRLDVIRSLLQGPRRVGEINDLLNVEQSLLSHHLRVLREAGLVESRRNGKAVLYRLSPALESRRRGRVLELGCCRLDFE